MPRRELPYCVHTRTEGAAITSGVATSQYKMKICGACERERPDEAYNEEQRGRRQSIRRCEECVAAGNQLVLMRKGRTRSEDDDCPICQLPLPLDPAQNTFRVCCMTKVCNGCTLTARKRGMKDCPFCRSPMPTEGSQVVSMIQKRVNAGDPLAMRHLGHEYADGGLGLEKDMTRAVELWERAAKLGVKEAHISLGCMYDEGKDVEKDTAKAIRHWEVAAMCGQVHARHNLGCEERAAGNHDVALQHFLISAKLGNQGSLNGIKKMFIHGLATKADYADALRGHQRAVEEMRSPDRDEARNYVT